MDPEELTRAFLAIEILPEMRNRLGELKESLSSDLEGVRWVRPSQIHLTLRFFGDLPQETLEKIGEVMLSVGRLHSPFTLNVFGVGCFPSTARPKVIWAGIRQSSELSALYAALERALGEMGVPPEKRRFHPHLTLGRVRRPLSDVSGTLGKFSDRDFGLLFVSKLTLYESRLQSTGAVHLPLRTVMLGSSHS